MNILEKLFPFLFKKNKNEQGVTLAQLEQDEKNRKFVGDIVRGHYNLPTEPNKKEELCNEANQAFKKWQEYQRHLYDTVPADRIKLRGKYMKQNKCYEFFPKVEYQAPSTDEYEIFLKDGFTEPFPSLHDFPEWAIGTQTTEIMVLSGISEAAARDGYLHIRHHFVNHQMTRAIIWFDLYLKK